MAQGTSMSSPFCAGVIALWLQANPLLSPAQVLNIFQTSSTTDGYTGSSLPNNTWGYGKINALTGIQQALNIVIPPTVVTNQATNITPTTAKLNGTITDGSEAIIDKGFRLYDPTTLNYFYFSATGTTNITADVTSLIPFSNYFYWAYAITDSDTTYGEAITFMTQEAISAAVQTDSAIKNSDGVSVTLYGKLTNAGNPTATEIGFECNYDSGNDTIISVPFTASTTTYFAIATLPLSATLHYKAYVKNYNGTTVYGQEKNISNMSLENVDKGVITLNIIPNPVNENAVLEISGLKSEAKISIIDMRGKETLLQTIDPNQYEATIDLRNYPSAVYYIRIENRENSITKKIIKR